MCLCSCDGVLLLELQAAKVQILFRTIGGTKEHHQAVKIKGLSAFLCGLASDFVHNTGSGAATVTTTITRK